MIKTDLFTRNIIKRTQQELQMWLPDLMRGLGYQKVYAPSEYILCVGEIPVMVVCHMDTVHQHVPKTVLCQHGIMWSPEGIGGDDRCGIYGAIEIAKRCQKRPFILFTTDEEIGGVGVQAFCRDFPENEYNIRFLVELDRKGYNDICFYQCDNPDFMEYAMVLCVCGLACVLGARVGIFNVGGEGQLLFVAENAFMLCAVVHINALHIGNERGKPDIQNEKTCSLLFKSFLRRN